MQFLPWLARVLYHQWKSIINRTNAEHVKDTGFSFLSNLSFGWKDNLINTKTGQFIGALHLQLLSCILFLGRGMIMPEFVVETEWLYNTEQQLHIFCLCYVHAMYKIFLTNMSVMNLKSKIIIVSRISWVFLFSINAVTQQ